MKISNRERRILYTLRKKYLKILDSKPVNCITIIETAIMVIEMYNRNCIWRLIEYIFLFIYSIKYLFTRKFDNLSIGHYQLKISFILDYLKINYTLSGRNITLLDTFFFPLFKILLNRNNTDVLSFLIKSDTFRITSHTDINSPEVKYFIEEYSRTLSTDVGFTYYFVFINTVNMNLDI